MTFQDIFSRKKEVPKKEEILPIVEIDYRERNCPVPSKLKKLGFDYEFKELKVGDYLIKGVVIERKEVTDFISSMLNGRLVKQLEEMQQYEDKLLIIEGVSKKELYSEEPYGVNPNSIRGFLLSIVMKYKIPTITTKDAEDTAKFIKVIATKKQREQRLNPLKKTLGKKEQLQFIIESFPGIGPKKAKQLLEEFSSIKRITNLSKEELKQSLGKKGEEIFEIINRDY